MGKLFLFEMRKSFLRLSLLFLLIGLAAVNLYKVREYVRIEGDSGNQIAMGKEDVLRTMKSHFYGEINQEMIDEIIAYSDKMSTIVKSGDYDTENPSDEFYTGYAFGDDRVIGDIQREVRDAYLYPNYISGTMDRADNAIEFFTGRNEYEVRKYEYLKTLYGERKINVYGDFEAAVLYFDYQFSSLVIMVLMIFVFSSSFSNEMMTGTDKIIKSGGRAGDVFWAKHFTMYAFAAVMTVFFSVMDLLYFGRFYGLQYLEQPLYTISEYRYTPYDITIFGAFAMSCLFKFIALVFVGEVILTVSSLTKNLGAAMTLCFAALGAVIFAGIYVPDWASPFNMFSTERMICSFDCLNVFGYPVPSFAVTAAITVICAVILHLICHHRTARVRKLPKEAAV